MASVVIHNAPACKCGCPSRDYHLSIQGIAVVDCLGCNRQVAFDHGLGDNPTKERLVEAHFQAQREGKCKRW